MTSWLEIAPEDAPETARAARLGDWSGVAVFSDVASEYHAAETGTALCDRSHRALIEVTGADRAGWLHNLTTNNIKELRSGDGNYAFALNVKGRVLFDLQAMVLDDSIWVDIERRWIDFARAHFEKYRVMEDVALCDRSSEFVRFALVGPLAAHRLADAGVSNAVAIPYLQVVKVLLDGTDVSLFRHDRCGVDAFDVLVPNAAARAFWSVWRVRDGVIPVGFDAIDTLRIEAGLPWPISELNDTVLPAETGQLDRAVSFAKGCYLGQEIVERMRSRQSVARKLVSLRFDGGHVPPSGATLFDGDEEVGCVTSARHSPASNAPVALGYARVTHAGDGTTLRAKWDGGHNDGRLSPIPKRD